VLGVTDDVKNRQESQPAAGEVRRSCRDATGDAASNVLIAIKSPVVTHLQGSPATLLEHVIATR
jgi:hypothetical protein